MSTANSKDSLLQFIENKKIKPTSTEIGDGAEDHHHEHVTLSGIDEGLLATHVAEELNFREYLVQNAFSFAI